MKRLREELECADKVVAQTAALFATVEPLEVSEIEAERVWRKIKARPRRRIPA